MRKIENRKRQSHISTVWDDYIEEVNSKKGISTINKIEFATSVKYLSLKLGKGYLKTSLVGNPIFNALAERSPNSILYIIWIANNLHEFLESSYPNDQIIKYLKNPSDCIYQGIPFLQIFNLFSSITDSIELEPSIPGFTKRPDIIFKTNQGRFFVEITHSEIKDIQKDNSAAFLKFHSFLDSLPLVYSCRLLRNISKEECNDQLKKLKNIIDIKYCTNKLFTFRNSFFEIGICHQKLLTELKDWVALDEKRDLWMKGVPYSPSVNSDKIADNIIETKVKQIPDNSIGIIAILVPSLLFFANPLLPMINKISRRINQKSQVHSVILFHQSAMKVKDIPSDFDNYNFFQNEIGNTHFMNYHIIKNKNFNDTYCNLSALISTILG